MPAILHAVFVFTIISAFISQHAIPPIHTGAEQTDKYFPALRGKELL
jgi:hypothetical protein